MSDGDVDRKVAEKAEMMLPPPEKKRKLNDMVPEIADQPEINDKRDDSDEEDDDEDYGRNAVRRIPGGPLSEKFKSMIRQDEELEKELLFYRMYDPIDVTDAISIFVNPQDLCRQGFDLSYFRVFFRRCHNRLTLQVYDHPGDPRLGGFVHCENEQVTEEDKKVATFAIARYNQLIDHNNGAVKASKLELKGVDKVSCTAEVDTFYYLTFKACDELKKEVKTYQAQVFESYEFQLLLGMLRDVASNKVLAILQLDEGPKEDEDSPAACCTSADSA